MNIFFGFKYLNRKMKLSSQRNECYREKTLVYNRNIVYRRREMNTFDVFNMPPIYAAVIFIYMPAGIAHCAPARLPPIVFLFVR